MEEVENKRQRRTPQERANELDEKITKINQSINELEEKMCIRDSRTTDNNLDAENHQKGIPVSL